MLEGAIEMREGISRGGLDASNERPLRLPGTRYCIDFEAVRTGEFKVIERLVVCERQVR